MSLKELIVRLLTQGRGSVVRTPHKFSLQEKRRDNRIDVGRDDEITIKILIPGKNDQGSTVSGVVKNVSLRGCRLVFQKSVDAVRLKLKEQLAASLHIEDFSIPLLVEVIRLVGNQEAALSFNPPFPKELNRLERFLQPRCLGVSLREINSRMLQEIEGRGLLWFQGVNETHLFSWMNLTDQSIVQQQLIFLGKVVEWTQGNPVRTGSVREDRTTSSGHFGWVQSDLLNFDSPQNRESLKQAKIILEASQIRDDIKDEFFKHLNKK